jgi:hypothetical protein
MSVQTGAIALVSWLMLFLFSEVAGRPVAIYLLARCVVNVLSIHADDADDADDADLAQTLLPTEYNIPKISGDNLNGSFKE